MRDNDHVVTTTIPRVQQAASPQDAPPSGLRATLINLASMRPLLRSLTVAAVVLLAGAAVLLATSGLQQPLLDAHITASIPVSVFVGMLLLLALGFAYLIAGALPAHWTLRWLVGAVLTAVLLAAPDSPLKRADSVPLQRAVSAAQLVLLGLLWLAILAITARRLLQRSDSQAVAPAARRLGLRFMLAAVGSLAYTGLGVLWWQSAPAHTGGTDLLSLAADPILGQLALLTFFLIIVLLWASPSYVELGESVGGAATGIAQRLRAPWLLVPLILLLAGYMVVDALRTDALDRGSLLTVLAVAAAMAIVSLLAGVTRPWPVRIPPVAVLLGVALLYTTVALAPTLAAVFSIDNPAHYWLGVLVPALSLPLFLALGAFLLVRGRALGQSRVLASGVYLLYLWILFGPSNVVGALQAAGLNVAALPTIQYSTILLVAAVLGVVLVALVALFRRRLADPAAPLVSALLALAGFEAINLLLRFSTTASSANTTAVGIGLFFFGTVLWDVLTSGADVTNGASAAFPRDARVLLYLGYNIVGAVLLLFVTTAQSTERVAFDIGSIQNTVVSGGAVYLGIPLVVLGALLRLGTWRFQERSAQAASSPLVGVARRSQGSAGAAQLGVLAAGALLTAAMVAVVLAHAAPPSAAAGPMVYSAQAPGPDCDSGQAKWKIDPVNTTTTCSSTGTTLALGNVASTSGTRQSTLAFTPPAGTFPTNYRVSVHIDFQGQSQSCLTLSTRYNGTGGYLNDVCASGAWDIARFDPSATPTLASGTLPQPLAGATVTATSQGSTQTLSINGAVVSSITDATYDTTSFIGLSVTNPGGGNAILSQFSYTPLPTSAG